MAYSQTLKLQHYFKSSPGIIYDHILNLKKFGELHPYMIEVKMIKQTEVYTEYYIKEKLLILGFIPLSPNYTAKVFEVEKNKHIRYTSTIMGKIGLSINFYFTEAVNSGETKITENINLEGNRIMCSLLIRMMKKTHLRLFEKLRATINN